MSCIPGVLRGGGRGPLRARRARPHVEGELLVAEPTEALEVGEEDRVDLTADSEAGRTHRGGRGDIETT